MYGKRSNKLHVSNNRLIRHDLKPIFIRIYNNTHKKRKSVF